MKIADLLLLFCLCPLAAWAQQRSETGPSDSASVDKVTILDPGISFGKPTLLLPPSLQDGAMRAIPPFLYSGRAPGVPPPFLGSMMDQKADLTSPLRLQMESAAKLRPLWMVLGTIEAGGAAYAAYQYVKKHGLK